MTIAVCFASATVVTRRYSGVRMTSAVCLGTIIACMAALLMSGVALRLLARPGAAVCFRRAQSRPGHGLVREWRTACAGLHGGLARNLRDHCRSGMGLADPWRGAVGAHRSWRQPWCLPRSWCISAWRSAGRLARRGPGSREFRRPIDSVGADGATWPHRQKTSRRVLPASALGRVGGSEYLAGQGSAAMAGMTELPFRSASRGRALRYSLKFPRFRDAHRSASMERRRTGQPELVALVRANSPAAALPCMARRRRSMKRRKA